MSALSKPTNPLSRLFSDWLLADRDIFGPESSLLPSRPAVKVPSVNIRETPNEFILDVAVPGLQRTDFKIEVENNGLTISARKDEQPEEKGKEDGYTRKEYSYGSFSRCFALPDNVDESTISAKYDNGILTVTIPKAKETTTKPVQNVPVK